MNDQKFPASSEGVFAARPASGASRAPRVGVAAWALAGALVLAGCFADERVAGGDDFPNSVETLGKSAATETSDTASWNGYEEAPATPPESYDSTGVPDAPPEDDAPAMGRRATGVEADGSVRIQPGFEILDAVRTLVSIFDSVTGLTRAVRVQTLTLAGITVRDTTWYTLQGLPLARRMVRMSGVVSYPAGRTERFAFEDADGDGILSPLPGSRNRARALFKVEHAAGRVEERTVIVSAGPDRVFATRGDNVLLSVETVHRVGADTLYRLTLAPVPGDSAVRDPQRASTRVDVVQAVAVGGARVTQAYRAEVYADAARNRALRYRRTTTTAAGTTEMTALGRDSLPEFAPGDTGFVRVLFTSAVASDTLASSRAVYRVALSDTAGRHAGNRLLAVEREKTYRLGPVSGRRYRLVPSAPVSAGAFARSGAVDLRVDLRAGGWIGFVGASSATGFSGTWMDDSGRSGVVHFALDGAIVTAP